MIEYVTGACGLILGSVLGAAFVVFKTDRQRTSNALKMRNPPPVPLVRQAEIEGLTYPAIHKLEMGDGSFLYEARIPVEYEDWSIQSVGTAFINVPVKKTTLRAILADTGQSQFETLAEAKQVAEAYYQRKLSETVINDTVI